MAMITIDPERLKHVRERRHLTQVGLAKKARVDKQTIYRLEHEKKPRRQGGVERIAKALDIEIGVLIGEQSLPADFEQPPAIVSDAGCQLNVRISAQARNAYSLAALQYGLRLRDIVELAPLLLVIAAEGSLRHRRETLEELKNQSARTVAVAGSLRHLPCLAGEPAHWDDAIPAERNSIQSRDIFGVTIPDDISWANDAFGFYEKIDNPFAAYLKQLTEGCDEIEIEAVSRSETAYEVCRSKILEIAGGDEAIADGLADAVWSGQLLIHEAIRSSLVSDDPQERVAWIKKLAQEATANAPALDNTLKPEDI